MSPTEFRSPRERIVSQRGANLDFEIPYDKFRENFPFRKLIADGRAAGVWGGSRAIRNLHYALDNLYAGLGLTLSIEAISTYEYDYNADGKTDFIVRFKYKSVDLWRVAGLDD